ncbi:MAG: hypothetical protein M1831_004783 [Alyxoria varia]|nr:MAG: hypothetical protein M1831_004783 [Alyxoria varia]
MPARLSSMELSPSSNPEQDPTSQPSRRKSGRVSKKPEHLSSSFNATKRKRAEARADDVDGDVDMNDASDAEANESEDDPDEEELREKLRKARRASGSKKSKAQPAPKKAKPNGATTTNLAIRPAKKPASKPRKAARRGQIPSAEKVGGLYGSVFGDDEALDGIGVGWLERFKEHESKAVAEIVNFVLRCASCEIEVDEHDIEDPDNCTGRLSDIQDEFQAKAVTDYPLIAKDKSTSTFRRNLISFINVLIQTIAASGHLLDQPTLLENIHVWVSTMSSASSRPFRHTATLVSLEILGVLSSLGRSYADERAKMLRQVEGEQKNKRVNQGRVNDLNKRAEVSAEKRGQIDNLIQDWFDTVFVHRYRDVDFHIRVDCVRYLSNWIMNYPDQFLDGQHLRYLGWVLSDVSAQTRLEVVKGLQTIFKDDTKLGGLRQFTERFRPRMVEMATRDAELNCRIAAVELLDILRDKGLLEPDDIDTLGKLMFDAEPRVRKALVPFFVASIEDSYQAKAEELGEEAIEEISSIQNDEDLESPKLDWMRIKSLAELMELYDTDEESFKLMEVDQRGLSDMTPGVDSRCSLAAQAVFEKLPILKQWEVLAGYLLADLSSATESAEGAENQMRQICKLNEKEEVILLDVLNAAVKLSLSEVVAEGGPKKAKKSKAQLRELQEMQEGAAQRLAEFIPRLLSKFGAAPEAASVVLRLGRVLNLDVFQELRQDSTTYSSLLEDINKQFLTHENQAVIAEARAALLHAKSFDELEEITDDKLQALWEDTTLNLATCCQGEDMETRGNLHITMVNAISSSVLRIYNLGSISDCTEALEKPQIIKSSSVQRKQKSTGPSVTPITCLIDILGRGVPQDDVDAELDAAEDKLVSHASKVLFFYFMWHTQSLKSSSASALSSKGALVSTLAERRDATTMHLRQILSTRRGADPLRISTAGTLLDLQTVLSTLSKSQQQQKQQQASDQSRSEREKLKNLLALTSSTRLTPQTQSSILKVFTAAERDYARKSGKTLDTTPDIDDEPEDLSDDDEDQEAAEPEDDDASEESEEEEPNAENPDDEEEEMEERAARRRQRRKAKKLRKAMLSERVLCELAGCMVMACFAGVLGDTDNDDAAEGAAGTVGAGTGGMVRDSAVKKRLLRNRMRLGPNFKEVVGKLDKPDGTAAPARAAKSRARKGGTTQAQGQQKDKDKGKGKASASVVAEDEDDDDDEDEEEERDEEGDADADADADAEVASEAAAAEPEERNVDGEVESVLGD